MDISFALRQGIDNHDISFSLAVVWIGRMRGSLGLGISRNNLGTFEGIKPNILIPEIVSFTDFPIKKDQTAN